MKNKLAEKTRGAQSEESVLKKAFKYFDLNDNGTVEPDEFAKAIEKIGIQIPTKQVSLSGNTRADRDARAVPHFSPNLLKINFNFISF